MNKRETVQAFVASIQQGEFENAKSMLADDFRFSGAISEPINTEAWLGMSANLKTAFPDLDYHFKVIGADGDVVRTTMQLSGTHSGSFDLTNVNMGVLPATNKAFSIKREKTKLIVKGTKITAWVVEETEGAGLKAILGQLNDTSTMSVTLRPFDLWTLQLNKWKLNNWIWVASLPSTLLWGWHTLNPAHR